MASANRIATILKGLKYPVEEVCEPNDLEDGAIKINDTLHVQVGFDYAIVVEALPDGCFRFGETRSHAALPSLLIDLHEKLYPETQPALAD